MDCETSSGEAPSAGEDGLAEVESLRALFRERRLSVRTMDRSLRVATGVAAVCLIVVVTLVALRDVPWPTVVLDVSSNDAVLQMPVVLFVATLAVLSIGFANLLTGAVIASRPVAGIFLLLITGFLGVQFGAFGDVFGVTLISDLPGWARWVSVGLIASIWAVAMLVWWVDLRDQRNTPRRSLRLVILAVYLVMFASYFTVLRLGSPHIGHLDLFPISTAVLMSELILLVNPMLQVAAVDFGEWGGLIGARVSGAIGANRIRALTALALALSLSLVVFGYVDISSGDPLLSATRLWAALRATVAVVAAAVLITVVGRWLGAQRGRWPATLNFAALFAVTAVSVYALIPLSQFAARNAQPPEHVEQVSPEGAYTPSADVVSVRSGTGVEGFTMLVPRSWQHRNVEGIDAWVGVVDRSAPDAAAHGSELVYVTVVPLAADAAEAAALGGQQPVGPQTAEGPWTRVVVAGEPEAALVWARPVPGAKQPSTFIMRQVVSGLPLTEARPMFNAIAGSFRPGQEPPATLPGAQEHSTAAGEHHTDVVTAISIGVAAALLMILLAAVGVLQHRLPRLVIGTVFLFGLTTLVAALYSYYRIARVVLGPDVEWPPIGYRGVAFGIGVVAVAALFATWRANAAFRRNLTVGLIILVATIWVLRGTYLVFGYALSAGQSAGWAGIVLLVAIAWDVTMSGESMTNHGSRHFPRATRILLFFGYSMITGAAILFFTAQRTVSTGQTVEPIFEPDAVTQAALFTVALPVAVLLFLLRLGRGRAMPPERARHQARTAGLS